MPVDQSQATARILPLPLDPRSPPAGPAPRLNRVSWRQHVAYLSRVWQPGGRTPDNPEANTSPHVSLIAPTGEGKTYLVTRGLLPLWGDDYRVLFVDCKDDDPILEGYATKVRSFPGQIRQSLQSKQWYRLKIPSRFTKATKTQQQNILFQALRRSYLQKDWLLIIDELRVPLRLGLEDFLVEIWERGRSQRVTMIADTQAPRWMPGHFYDQPGHLYIGSTMDQRTRIRLKEIAGNSKAIVDAMPQLRPFEFIYVGEKGRKMEIVKVGRR